MVSIAKNTMKNFSEENMVRLNKGTDIIIIDLRNSVRRYLRETECEYLSL